MSDRPMPRAVSSDPGQRVVYTAVQLTLLPYTRRPAHITRLHVRHGRRLCECSFAPSSVLKARVCIYVSPHPTLRESVGIYQKRSFCTPKHDFWDIIGTLFKLCECAP